MKLNHTFLPTLLLLALPLTMLAQRPSIMVVPADVYMNQSGFTNAVTQADGSTRNLPDYQRMFENDRYFRILTTAINSAFQDVGYPITDFEATLKRLQNREVELSLSDRPTQLSMRDMILSQAKADIIMDIDFFVERQMGEPSISFTLNAIDSYTSEPVASVTQSGLPGGGTNLSTLVKESVVQNMPVFEGRLMNHFNNIRANGRSGIVEVRLSEESPFDLEEYIGTGSDEEELGIIIRELIKKNAVNNVYRVNTSSRTLQIFEDVKVPIFDEEGMPLDVETWANRVIVRELRQKYRLDVRRESLGLSHVRLIIMGER
jgi:hypothetical protein